MKNQISNIALEGTCSGDVVGGLLMWTVGNLQAFLFLNKAQDSLPKRKPASLAGFLG